MTAAGELVGLSRTELVAQLGPPSAEHGGHLEWFLGERDSGASMMFPYRDYLGVLLDEQATCARVAVFTRD